MIERIKKLAEQAGLLPKEIGPVVETRHMKNKQHDLELFAELIVREAHEIIVCGGVDDVDDVLKYFGVEE
jgi:hypothetical protein